MRNDNPHSVADDLVGQVLRSIPEQPLPDLAPAVMSRIRASRPSAKAAAPSSWLVRATEWLTAPRPMTIHWRPAYAFALVASLMAAPLAMRALPTTSEAAAAKQIFVQFRLDAPSAQNVRLAGDFTNWKATVSLQRSASGVWTVLVPLQPGVHSYSFVINGQEWVTDPTAPTVSDGFGGRNSQLAVLTPEPGRAM